MGVSASLLILTLFKGTANSFFATRCYAALAELLLTYKVPALSFIPETRNDIHIRQGFAMLSAWIHIPFMRRGLVRIRCMMEKAGISVEPETSEDGIDYAATTFPEQPGNFQG
jgi:hypothetical protein